MIWIFYFTNEIKKTCSFWVENDFISNGLCISFLNPFIIKSFHHFESILNKYQFFKSIRKESNIFFLIRSLIIFRSEMKSKLNESEKKLLLGIS